jgi:tetratricopeptide (TPR) repeat protein
MTSHIFLAMGMWPETEAANVRSNAVFDKMMANHHMANVGCGHPDIWLVYARLQQGKDVAPKVDACRADAEKLIAEAKDLSVVGYPEGSTSSWADMAVRTGIETGKWPKEWLQLPTGRLTFARFTEDYGRLLASRRDGPQAQSALASMKADQQIIAANFSKEFPDDATVMPWVERAMAQAQAVTALALGRTDDGLALLRKAAEAEAALPPPFGPPALQKPSYELLGDELLALGRKAEAADAYRHALAAAPGRRLSLAGLKAATAP